MADTKEQGGGGQPMARSGEVTSVLAIGAAAGQGDSIVRFFSAFEADAAQATVVVVKNREALDERDLAQALDRNGRLLAVAAQDGMALAGGTVYLCLADCITTLANRRFAVRQAEQAPGLRGTIDSLLVSVAEEWSTDAIGVILAGTGEDGTLGVAALREGGGLAIVESPAEDAAGEHLADSNTPAALADVLLPADRIAEHARVYLRHLRQLGDRREVDDAAATAAGSLARIAELIRNQTGNDFHGYKQNTFLRRVQRRMHVVQIAEIGQYVERLRTDKGEVIRLFDDLLIGVTQFFRDKKEFEVLESQVVPQIFEGKGAGQHVRVWVLGCATGEEAYSIGIVLREYMARLEHPPQVQIFATDIDGRALAAARVGRYHTNIERHVTPERLARWFVREGDTFCVVKELREMCIFSQHNVIKDAPFSRLDLVSCRNLLIYLNVDLQNRVIPLFHFALLPDRFLFLGNSENVTRQPKLFVPVDRRARIFKRLSSGTRALPEFPIPTGSAPAAPGAPPTRVRGFDLGLEHRAQRVAERHAPAYVITDDAGQVLHFSGRMGRYLEPASGAASLELLNLVHRDLRQGLRNAIGHALNTFVPVAMERVPFSMGVDTQLVDVTVEPMQEQPDGARHLVVLFKEAILRTPERLGEGGGEPARDEEVARLGQELRATRERLQATIEELESTNEELKSSNEEYQSLNEELQSANEELQTSREELQSVNEELTTVNGELAHRIQELTRATSDLKNFLESTQIATVFLDNDLRIMNFTPAVTEVFHLVDTDIGRPLSHIKARIPVELLFKDARRVQQTLGFAEIEVPATDSATRYIVRILPYRSIDNFIAGVVITFVDVTALTQAEERQSLILAELQHRVRNTLDVVRSIVRRSAEMSDSVQDYAARLEGRLNAFARTQALVTRDPAGGVDLQLLIVEELLASNIPDPDKLRLRGPAVYLTSKVAETLGLAIHELATNAARHGALSLNGDVDVTWSTGDDRDMPQLTLSWQERGGPPMTTSNPRRGFGTELLEKTLAFELKATTTISFDPEGLHCTIRMPLVRPKAKA